jgi:hypothetical protein
MKLVIGLVIGLLIAGGVFYAITANADSPVAQRIQNAVATSTPVLSAFDVQRVSARIESDSELFGDYKVHVYCSFSNSGRARVINVESTVNAQNGTFTKNRQEYIDQGQTKDFHFVFAEVDYALFGDNSLNYNCYMKSQRDP